MPRASTFAFVTAAIAAAILSSCSPVKFSAQDNSEKPGDPNTPVDPQGNVSCNPRMNGSATSLTLTIGSSTNPSLTANCTPSSVNYAWSVTRNNAAVTINGLGGATSTPDFLAAGAGTYFITLDATAIGWNSYHLNTPLQVTVQNGTPTAQNITCSPKINGSLTSITLSGTNPTVTANCSPTNVSYVWTAQRDGTTTTVPGLTGSSSTPDFVHMTPGTYQVWLSANQTGYNPYTSTSPLTIVVPQGGGGGTPVSSSHSISVSNNKLDILLVIDDSSSMLADNQRLAARLEGFVNDLSAQGFDWQMCVTLTRAQRISNDNPNYYWGASYNWSGNPNSPAWILKSGTTNAFSIFTNTINQIGAGWAGTDDERAVKAAYWHLWNGEPGVSGTSGCYRREAGLAVIILSDEDERSVGGDTTQIVYDSEKDKPLETDDLPQTYTSYVRQVFGNEKRFSVNSIIVRPGDATCKAAQDAEGSKSHYGVKYAELSTLTSGFVGSICDTDYSTNLKYFKDAIVRSQASLPLQCTPVGSVTETVAPPYTHTTAVDNQRLVFTPQIPAGSTVQLNYTCP